LLEEFKNSVSKSFSATSSAPGAAVETDLAEETLAAFPTF